MRPPGGLSDGQRRPKALRLAPLVDWYVVAPGRFELVGSGDVSADDLRAVHGELGDGAVFVCVAKPPPLEKYLRAGWGTTRVLKRSRPAVSPKLHSVARGARLAVLPGRGIVWVDDEHLFKPGEPVPLPWTDPPVELVVVRPGAVYAAMKAALGPGGPRRARLPATP